MRDGVSGRHFCFGCICFLASVLAVQVCVLATLLRRLAEVHRSAVPTVQGKGQVHAAAAASLAARSAPGASIRGSATAAASSYRAESPGRPAGAATAPVSTAVKPGLALGSTFGLGDDAVLIFLASLLSSAPLCDVVLFVDEPLSQSVMQAVGIDVQRVVFETAGPLPSPWSTFFKSSSRYLLYRNYIERTKAVEKYRYLQVSDVGNVAFQADPFVWVAHQPIGLHLFADEPGLLIGADHSILHSMVQCYGEQAASQVGRQAVVPTGYVIGSPREVQIYISNVVEQLVAHTACQKEAVDEAIHNAVIRSPRLESELRPHVHENRRGPVWTGSHVPQANIKLDSGNFVINEDGYRYAVLHQYDQHEAVWRLLSDRHLAARKKRLATLDCSTFDVAPGDLRGFDLSHSPADSQKDCCIACLGDSGCGSFVFKISAKHCWLKRPGANTRSALAGTDTLAGISRQNLNR